MIYYPLSTLMLAGIKDILDHPLLKTFLVLKSLEMAPGTRIPLMQSNQSPDGWCKSSLEKTLTGDDHVAPLNPGTISSTEMVSN